MLVANIKMWKSHLNIREGSDYLSEIVRMTARLLFTPKKGIVSFSGKGQFKKMTAG